MRSDQIKLGFERAPHRGLLRATGVVGENDFHKPFIAVCNSYVDVVPGHVHLQAFGKLVKEAIRAAGGVPFEFNTIGVDDGIAMGHIGMKYSLPSRELIADCVETMVEAHRFDGMVCIPNCDKIVPGMLMAALRIDIPTIFISGGPMAAGKLADGRTVDLISIFEGVGAYQAGKIDDQELLELEQQACPTCGSCSGMFTANSMNCLMEAVLIMPLPLIWRWADPQTPYCIPSLWRARQALTILWSVSTRSRRALPISAKSALLVNGIWKMLTAPVASAPS